MYFQKNNQLSDLSNYKSTTYEEYLEKNGKLTYRNIGTSMEPMLKQGRDLFTVKKKTAQRCKKYDVVLYRRSPNYYVLHRVIKVRDKDYVILGDNCINKEYGITDGDILGVMTEFVRKGHVYKVSNKIYMLYSRIWVATYRLRRIILGLKAQSHKIKK